MRVIRRYLHGAGRRERDTAKGLVQDDSLIVAALERFVAEHEDDAVIFCSHNTHDFAQKSQGSEGNTVYVLHPDVQERIGSVRYFSDPVELAKNLPPTCSPAEDAELDEYSEPFQKESERRRALHLDYDFSNLAGISSVVNAARASMPNYSGSLPYSQYASAFSILTREIDALIPNTGQILATLGALDVGQFAGLERIVNQTSKNLVSMVPQIQNAAFNSLASNMQWPSIYGIAQSMPPRKDPPEEEDDDDPEPGDVSDAG